MSKKQSKVSNPVSSKKASKGKSAAAQAAQAEPVAVVTTTAPAADRPAAAVTVHAAAKPAKPRKSPREERNGVKRPKANGLCGRVWAHLDAQGDMSVADIRAWAVSEGLNPGNAAIEIYGWRKFNGIKPVKVAKLVKAPKASMEVQQATG